jgi:hypothetical protein
METSKKLVIVYEYLEIRDVFAIKFLEEIIWAKNLRALNVGLTNIDKLFCYDLGYSIKIPISL